MQGSCSLQRRLDTLQSRIFELTPWIRQLLHSTNPDTRRSCHICFIAGGRFGMTLVAPRARTSPPMGKMPQGRSCSCLSAWPAQLQGDEVSGGAESAIAGSGNFSMARVWLGRCRDGGDGGDGGRGMAALIESGMFWAFSLWEDRLEKAGVLAINLILDRLSRGRVTKHRFGRRGVVSGEISVGS